MIRGPYTSLTIHMTVAERHDWWKQQGRESYSRRAFAPDPDMPSKFMCAGCDGNDKKLRAHSKGGVLRDAEAEWYNQTSSRVNGWTI